MTMNKYERDLGNHAADNAVGESMFGANFVAGINQVGGSSDYINILESLGTTTIRYPGGTVTEQYFDPSESIWRELFVERKDQVKAPDGRIVEGPGRLFEYAAENDLKVQFVLPTAGLVKTVNGKIKVDSKDIAQVKKLVSDLLDGKFGSAEIEHFEIGNEYYFFADLSPKEYAAVASALISAVSDAIAEHRADHNLGPSWDAPKIAIQSGAGWREGDNDKIIAGLNNKTLSNVDSVIFHYYPETLDDVGTKERHLGQIDDWIEATGKPDIGFFVSEWNVYGPSADTGLAQASTVLATFHEMVVRGVDAANIWGVQFRYLDAGLSTNFGGPTLQETDARLSVSGEIMASLQESVLGLKAVEASPYNLIANKSARQATDITTFGNEERAVIYISSRSDKPIDLKLKLGSYFDDVTHVWGEVLSSVDDEWSTWADESNPLDPNAVPQFTILSNSDIQNGNGMSLGAYEIVRISVEFGDNGVIMADHDPITTSAISYDDTLVGSRFDDRITAHVGDDALLGRHGNDGLRGGDGHDKIFGGSGKDALFGDAGNDKLEGGMGRDQVIGGTGNDLIMGGESGDILSGGLGHDTFFGGKGADIIIGGQGNNIATGGGGADYFVLSDPGSTIITDLNYGAGDRITFLGKFNSASELLANVSLTGSDSGDSSDLVVEMGSYGSATFIGMANDLDRFVSSVVDFDSSGIRALALAKKLNAHNAAQTSDYFSDISLVSFFAEFGGADTVILFQSLEAKVAARVLNAVGADNLLGLLELVGESGLITALSDHEPEEIVKFFDITSNSTAANIVEYVGAQKAKSLLDGMNHEDRERLESKLLAQTDELSRDEDSIFRAVANKYFGDQRSDKIVGNGKDENLFGRNGDDVLVGRGGSDKALGHSGQDELMGGAGQDILKGGIGGDILSGGRGDDFVFGGMGEDRIVGLKGRDLIFGGAGADKLNGNGGRDEMLGGDGGDFIIGGKGSDLMKGGQGTDTLKGGREKDIIFGGQSHDNLNGGSQDDCLYGGHGFDKIIGGKGRDQIDGGSGDDRIIGGIGNDNVLGGRGSDEISGGKGNDYIDGGSGNDRLSGGGGADVFVFRGEGNDVVTDFKVGSDILALVDTNFTLEEHRGSVVIHFEDDSLKLNGVSLETFTSNDLFVEFL